MLQPWVVEEMLKKERPQAWEPVPLHAPMPAMEAPRPFERNEWEDELEPERSSTVLIIDIETGDVTRM